MNPIYEILDFEVESTIQLNHRLEVIKSGNCISDLFETFFQEHQFHENHRLPYRLHTWIIDEIQRKSPRNSSIPFRTMTTYIRHGRVLIAILLRHPADPYYLLYLEEDPTALQQYESIKRKLTRRQLEMFHHYKDGERNITSIAKKMGISVRTAEGHKMNLQRILGDV